MPILEESVSIRPDPATCIEWGRESRAYGWMIDRVGKLQVEWMQLLVDWWLGAGAGAWDQTVRPPVVRSVIVLWMKRPYRSNIEICKCRMPKWNCASNFLASQLIRFRRRRRRCGYGRAKKQSGSRDMHKQLSTTRYHFYLNNSAEDRVTRNVAFTIRRQDAMHIPPLPPTSYSSTPPLTPWTSIMRKHVYFLELISSAHHVLHIGKVSLHLVPGHEEWGSETDNGECGDLES